MKHSRLGAGGATLISLAVMLAGCSSSGKSATNAGGGNSTRPAATTSGSVQATARAKVAQYAAQSSSYPGPTQAFHPGAGKAAVMGCGFNSAVCADQAKRAVAALQAMGWQTGEAFDGQNSPQVESGFVDRAVQNKLDGIILASVDPNTIKAAIDRAIAAKLPIICTNCASGGYNKHGVIDVAPDWVQQGQIAAWKVLADEGDKAKIQTFADKQFLSSVQRSQGLQATIKANCPSCTVTYHDFPSSDYGKPGPPAWTALLASNPKGSVTYVVGHYDGLDLTISKTNVQSGRTEIKVGGYDGDTEALSALVTANPPYNFSVAEPVAYEEWSGADLLGRIKAGQPLWTGSDKLPSQLVTKDNAATLLKGNPAGSSYPAPVGDWQGNFKKLWGRA